MTFGKNLTPNQNNKHQYGNQGPMPQNTNPNPNPTYDLNTNAITPNKTNITPSLIDMLMQQIQAIQQQMKNMQLGSNKKAYSIEELYPFPFERNISMSPFPPHFIAPPLPKYKGKGDPIEHIQEFNTSCMEVAYDPTYLMCSMCLMRKEL